MKDGNAEDGDPGRLEGAGRTLEESRTMAQRGGGKGDLRSTWDRGHGTGDRMSPGLHLALGTCVTAHRLSPSLCKGAPSLKCSDQGHLLLCSGRNPAAHSLSAWTGQPHCRAAAARGQPKPADRGGPAVPEGGCVPAQLSGQQRLPADTPAHGNRL